MTIDPNVLDRYRSAGLTHKGLEYIHSVRAAPPSRRVGGTRFLAVSGRFPSCKMKCTIQAESRTGEYPFILSIELDADVLEYYDQPNSIVISRHRRGRLHVSRYTPDFLVLRTDFAEVIEVKPRDAVVAAVEEYPAEWARRDGRWCYLPVAAHFEPMGIRHYVHVSEDINGVLAANLNLLVAAQRLPPLPNEEASLRAAQRLVDAGGVVTLHELVTRVRLPEVSAVFRWIANGHLEAALGHQLLANLRSTRVFNSKTERDQFVEACTLGSQPAKGVGAGTSTETESTLTASIEALTSYQLNAALTRYKETLPAIMGERAATRQQRRYLQRMRLAMQTGQNPLCAFAPRVDKRGNRQSRITAEQEALMRTAVETHYSTPARRSAKWVYSAIPWGEVRRLSYNTFLAYIRRTPRHELARKRSGHRMALALRPPTHPDVRAVWPTCAWELVHIDHTPMDEKVWADLGFAEILQRPWITTMIDALTECVLAFWIAFSPPSWQSLAMLLRDCVRRHGRLPLGMISDQGADFGGTFWETFSASHGCTKFDRPVAHAATGSQVERSFNQLHRDLIYQLDGNMQNDRAWRSATSSHKANATARYLLERIYSECDQYLFDHYNQRPHGTNTFSPFDRLRESVQDLRVVAPTAYDRAFLIETAALASRQTSRIDNKQGIRLGQRIYWHDALAQPKYHNERVELRIEPFNSSLVYVHLDGRWIDCVDRHSTQMRSLDEFGRWAQSVIDFYGKPFARAAKQLADERFAKKQAAAWASDRSEANAELTVEVGLPEAKKARLRLPKQATDATEPPERSESEQAKPTTAFDHLRTAPIEPLERLEP